MPFNKGPFTNTCMGGGTWCKKNIVKNIQAPSDLKKIQVPFFAMKIMCQRHRKEL